MFKQKHKEAYPSDPDYDFLLKSMEDETEMQTFLPEEVTVLILRKLIICHSLYIVYRITDNRHVNQSLSFLL